MNVELVYGRKGVGKSAYIHQKCGEICKDFARRAIVIVPDQYSHETELSLIAASGRQGLANIEVLTFKRLAHRIKLRCGGAAVNTLSSKGRAMLICSIVSKSPTLRENSFAAGGNKTGIWTEFSTLIAQMKQHGVTPEQLREHIPSESQYQHTAEKMRQVADVFGEYESYLEQLHEGSAEWDYIDGEDESALLCENLRELKPLADTEVFIDGFDDFSLLDLTTVEEIIKTAKAVTIVLPCGMRETSRRELFSRQLRMSAKLDALLAELGVTPKRVWIAKDSVQVPAVVHIPAYEGKSPELAHIEEQVFCGDCKPWQGVPSDVALTVEPSPEAQAEHMADEIVRLVRDSGYRYREIAALCGDMDESRPYLISALEKREIPFFMDAERGIKNNALVRLLLGILRISSGGKSFAGMFGLLKAGFDELCGLAKEDVNYLERYCKRYSIRGTLWERDFTLGGDSFDIDRLNLLRQKVQSAVGETEAVLNQSNTAGQFVSVLRQFLEQSQIADRLAQEEIRLNASGLSAYALENSAVYHGVEDIFEQISKFIGDIEYSASDFADLLEGLFAEEQITVIPAGMDQVSILSPGRTSARQIKALFLLSADMIQGTLPLSSCIFNTQERDWLKQSGVDIGGDSGSVISDQQYYFYQMLSTPTKKLYLSRIDYGANEDKQKNPVLMQAVQSVFPELAERKAPSLPYTIAQADNEGAVLEALLFEQSTLRNAQRYQALLGQKRKEGAVSEEEYQSALTASARYFQQKEERIQGLTQWFSQNRAEKYFMADSAAKQGRQYSLTTSPVALSRIFAKDGKRLVMDISKLESYQNCPYAFYVRYCIAPRMESGLRISSLDVGNFIHDMVHLFTENVLKDKSAGVADGKAFLDAVYDQVAEKNGAGRFSADGQNQYILSRLRSLMQDMLSAMVIQRDLGAVELLGSEVPIGMGEGQVPPLEDVTPGGVPFRVLGKIDRVEYAKGPSPRWIVSDYKTGRNPPKISEVLQWEALQLPVYLYALEKGLGGEAGAMFYVSANDKPEPLEQNQAPEQQREKRYGRMGVVSNSEAVMNALVRQEGEEKEDNAQQQRHMLSSQVFSNVQKTKFLEQAELENVIQQAFACCMDIIDDISTGEIPKKPKRANRCQFCPYRRMCGYDPDLPNRDNRPGRRGKKSPQETT